MTVGPNELAGRVLDRELAMTATSSKEMFDALWEPKFAPGCSEMGCGPPGPHPEPGPVDWEYMRTHRLGKYAEQQPKKPRWLKLKPIARRFLTELMKLILWQVR